MSLESRCNAALMVALPIPATSHAARERSARLPVLTLPSLQKGSESFMHTDSSHVPPVPTLETRACGLCLTRTKHKHNQFSISMPHAPRCCSAWLDCGGSDRCSTTRAHQSSILLSHHHPVPLITPSSPFVSCTMWSNLLAAITIAVAASRCSAHDIIDSTVDNVCTAPSAPCHKSSE